MNVLNLVDSWFTLQGEGLHSGRRALFVRLPFCNLACSWCDTEFDKFDGWTEAEFVAHALAEPTRFAVVTGGEPLMNKQTPRIVDLLRAEGYEIACESNGTMAPNARFDFVTVSPKKFAADKRQPGQLLENYPAYYVHPEAFAAADEFKYVVDAGFDFAVLARHDTSDGRRYSLSPEFNDFNANTARIVEFLKENPQWRFSLQSHKFLGLP